MTSSSSPRCRKGLAVLAAAVCAAGATGLAPAYASDVREPAADAPWVVSLGDSFISGEAGRWAGNSNESEDGWSRTDRAYDPETDESDPKRVYGASYDSGCNRSDVAEVQSLTLAVRKLNLACSGATSTAVKLPEHGGEPFKGEPSQAGRLQQAVTGQQVRAVVVSIGGNDLGFSDIITDCTKQFLKPFGGSPCAPDAGQQVKERLPGVRTAVVETLADVRTALERSGHAAGSYRLVLQSYPSPLPDAGRVRYPGEKYDRFTQGGCPFYDRDLTWAHDDLVPQISATLAEAAHEAGAEFLDLSRAFEGREVCSTTTRHADLAHPPSGKTSEWMRFLTTGAGQGQLQESLHPDRYGQQALGTCLSLQLEQPTADRRCLNTPGRGPAAMELAAIG
ncbi:GDSL-type esterase/lipase family protein [Kitasatospora phosalacinea]|uniref:GDSL-type esterase/lipase family protein n=1 Tax=Kitasatospora phosalacinea TaxID=2065 RepID=UPI001428CD96|nr:GDSL-type esterase/lipase family protein [Kitasatospora phosalacinea]